MWKVSEGLAALHLGLEATRFHNHDSSEHAAIHANNRRPTEAEKQESLRLDRGMTNTGIATVHRHHGASTNWQRIKEE